VLCFLCGRNWIFKHYLQELWLQIVKTWLLYPDNRLTSCSTTLIQSHPLDMIQSHFCPPPILTNYSVRFFKPPYLTNFYSRLDNPCSRFNFSTGIADWIHGRPMGCFCKYNGRQSVTLAVLFQLRLVHTGHILLPVQIVSEELQSCSSYSFHTGSICGTCQMCLK
jgi:hypothetical protein